LYILTIPVAATAFTVSANGFFDANLAREPGIAQDVATLERDLTNILDSKVEASKALWPPYAYMMSEPEVTQVVRGQGGPGTMAVEVFSGVGLLSNPNVSAAGPLWFQLGPLQGYSTDNSGHRTTYQYQVQPVGLDGFGSESIPKPLDRVVAADFGKHSTFVIGVPGKVNPSVLGLDVPENVHQVIQNLLGAYERKPADASGLYLRMLYVSATTITTLGIGDIQPVSNTARGLLTAEAVIGVLLAGLFLNAIGRSVRGARGSPSNGAGHPGDDDPTPDVEPSSTASGSIDTSNDDDDRQ
jgi:hypothetical protein